MYFAWFNSNNERSAAWVGSQKAVVEFVAIPTSQPSTRRSFSTLMRHKHGMVFWIAIFKCVLLLGKYFDASYHHIDYKCERFRRTWSLNIGYMVLVPVFKAPNDGTFTHTTEMKRIAYIVQKSTSDGQLCIFTG